MCYIYIIYIIYIYVYYINVSYMTIDYDDDDVDDYYYYYSLLLNIIFSEYNFLLHFDNRFISLRNNNNMCVILTQC